MRVATAVGVVLLLFIGAPAAANFVPIDNGVPIVAPDGPNVTVTGATNVSLNNSSATFPDANTVHINTTDGDATFTSNGDTQAAINKTDIEGTWTNVTRLAVNRRLSIDPADKTEASVEGDTDTFSFRQNIAADDGTPDFVYSGTSGTTTVVIRGLSANQAYKAVDSSGTELASANSDANGAVTFTGLPNSQHVIRIQTTDIVRDDSIVDVGDDGLTPDRVTRETLLLLLAVGLLGSYAILSRPLEESPAMRILGGAFLVLVWGMVSLWATDYIIVHSVGGGTTVRSNTVLSLLAVVAGALQLLDVFKSGASLIGENSQS